MLMTDALRRIARVAQTVAVHLIVVDAKDDLAATFYERFGFKRMPGRPTRLFIAVATVRALDESP
jgi:hypothetical protein